jgi:hypothetical protein
MSVKPENDTSSIYYKPTVTETELNSGGNYVSPANSEDGTPGTLTGTIIE